MASLKDQLTATFALFIHKGEETGTVSICASLSSVRYCGRKMLSLLMAHPSFKAYLKSSALPPQLNNIMERIKKKVSAWQKKCLLDARTESARMR